MSSKQPPDAPNILLGYDFELPTKQSANATVSMSGEIPDSFLNEFDESDFIPPEEGQNKAQQILDIREEYDNVNGGTDTGWRRAEQIAAGIPIPPDEVRQIDAWFSRHPKSEASDAPEDEPWTDNGWTARMLWGWDPAQEWAEDLAADIRDFEEQSENTTRKEALVGTANDTLFSEGDAVQTPQGLGVVTEVRTSAFTGKGDEDVDASESSPTYVVALKDGRVGVGFYSASELDATELPETAVDDPVDDVEQSANAVMEMTANGLVANDWQPPESWEESETPVRVIGLDAWSSMGGQFDCPGGGCCKGTMRPKLGDRGSDEFCASFKDWILGGWEGWRK